MQIIGLILLVVAYTIGIMTICLEIVCYQRKMEDKETIFFSIAFLLVIFAISVSFLFDAWSPINSNFSNAFLYISMVGLSLTTPLNIFAERQLNMSGMMKNSLMIISGLLVTLILCNLFFDLQFPIHIPVNIFLAISVFTSMIFLMKSKPGVNIKHRDKIERITAIGVMTILPIFLALEFFFKIDVPITIVVFFIILAASKFFDYLKRLSLLKPENEVQPKQIKNFNLTQREQEVADLLIKGTTYAKIGETLFISMPTVKTHVSNIYRKVGVKNKMELFYALSDN